MGIRVYLHVRQESLTLIHVTRVLAHVFWNTLLSLPDEAMHTVTRSDQELGGIRKKSPAEFGRYFPEEVYHMHFLCLTSSPQASRWHAQKSWQKIWVGRKRKSCPRQDHHTILLKTLYHLWSSPLCILRAASSQMTPFLEIYFIKMKVSSMASMWKTWKKRFSDGLLLQPS